MCLWNHYVLIFVSLITKLKKVTKMDFARDNTYFNIFYCSLWIFLYLFCKFRIDVNIYNRIANDSYNGFCIFGHINVNQLFENISTFFGFIN